MEIMYLAGVAEWQTRATQNREGNRGGSSPFTGIKSKKSDFLKTKVGKEILYFRYLFCMSRIVF
jgi:hypothetical protein